MRRRVKGLRRIGAGTLAAAMIFGLAVPYQALNVSAEPADGTAPVNLAIGATATANDVEPFIQISSVTGFVGITMQCSLNH